MSEEWDYQYRLLSLVKGADTRRFMKTVMTHLFAIFPGGTDH